MTLVYIQEMLFYSDVDECMSELDNCDKDAECTNTIGNFTCACNTGFTGDGYSCSMFGGFVLERELVSWRISEGRQRG